MTEIEKIWYHVKNGGGAHESQSVFLIQCVNIGDVQHSDISYGVYL